MVQRQPDESLRRMARATCCFVVGLTLMAQAANIRATQPYLDPRALDHWQSRHSLALSNDLLTVTFGNGVFAGGGTAGRLIASTNAVDWNIVQGFGGSVDGIVYADGHFVGVGGSFSGALLETTDGISWQIQSAASLPGVTH